MSIHVTALDKTPVVPVSIEDNSDTRLLDIARLLEYAERSAADRQTTAIDYISRARALLAQPAPVCTTGGLAPWQIKRIERHIEERMEYGVTLTGLADLAGLTPSYFCKAFKKSFGTSPLAHVQNRRIDRAKDLMLNTDQSLAEIAFTCGLCDQSHFSRIFRKVSGMSPSQWRRSFRMGQA